MTSCESSNGDSSNAMRSDVERGVWEGNRSLSSNRAGTSSRIKAALIMQPLKGSY